MIEDFPIQLKKDCKECAVRQDISLKEFVKRALEAALREAKSSSAINPSSGRKKKR